MATAAAADEIAEGSDVRRSQASSGARERDRPPVPRLLPPQHALVVFARTGRRRPGRARARAAFPRRCGHRGAERLAAERVEQERQVRRPLVRGGTELGQRQHRDGELRDKPRCLPCAERLGDGARGPLAAHQGGESLTRLSVRAVEVRDEDPDVVVDVLQVLAALELHQHVRELLAASGVDRADDERGHVRVLAQVPFDPVGEHPRRNRVHRRRAPAAAARAPGLASRLCGSGVSVGRHAPQ